MLLNILTYPNPLLAKLCDKIILVNHTLVQLAELMVETMYAISGIGLAAPQIGELIRLIVIDLSISKNRKSPLFLFNPRIVDARGIIVYEEGCLSLPGLIADVTRAAKVIVLALDKEGKEITIKGEGLLAVCLQHEIDHLEGRLFLERIDFFKRNFI